MPPDKRVPMTPEQCARILKKFPGVELFVQPSEIRAFEDAAYAEAGIELREDLSNCDYLFGVKEVPASMLIPGKTYFFFSHTYKKQPYNRHLLAAIVEKRISLIDYELLTDDAGRRLIGFGRYAGIVGCYNGLLAMGRKWGIFELKPAHLCENRAEVEQELKKVRFPKGFKLVLTGGGRVAGGALEMLALLPISRVAPEVFLSEKSDDAVYTQLNVQDYNRKPDGAAFATKEFYAHPERFESNFFRFARVAHMYIPCHYWDDKAPYLFTREEARHPDFKIELVADISCDINGPVASTLRPSTIAEPLYGYNPISESETDFNAPGSIGVMAVDNLPCELPKDASEDFGNELINNVLTELLSAGTSAVIERGRQTDLQGKLTAKYAYLQGYLEGH